MKSEPLDLFEKLQTKEDIDYCITFSLTYHYEVAEAAMENWHIWDDNLRRYYVKAIQHRLKIIDLSKVDKILERYSASHIKLCNLKVDN